MASFLDLAIIVIR